jgi:hypothetical protein
MALEGGKFKASPLVGERFGERFSRSRDLRCKLFLIGSRIITNHCSPKTLIFLALRKLDKILGN